MNEELKEQLKTQGKRISVATHNYEASKQALEQFDANSRVAVRADNVKRTEADVDALVLSNVGRLPLFEQYCENKAELEGLKTDTQCLLAHVSLICSETAALSRIAQ